MSVPESENYTGEQRYGAEGRTSPASAVCYQQEFDIGNNEDAARGRQPEDAALEREPRLKGALLHSLPPGGTDSAPGSEAPSILPTPAAWEPPIQSSIADGAPEAAYFSPRPMRYYPAYLPASASAPQSTEPSPSHSLNTSTSSVNLPQHAPIAHTEPVTPIDFLDRPGVQRDLSSSSTASHSTVRAASTDQATHYTLPSKAHRDYPQYPNQAYSALQSQIYPSPYPPQILRSRSSHPSQHASFSAPFGLDTQSHRHDHDRASDHGSRTAGNSPAGSPGLFSPAAQHKKSALSHTDESGTYPSPYLHYTHRQMPKETHVADVDVDPVSGRKIINQYEIIDELGRGVHGKVKLGRSLQSGHFVAIKIVDRYSKKRRLGKNASHEDKIKREIAILKKARHPNIVGLLEVIDDPTRKKVYIVLEHVELGEVQWRAKAEPEVEIALVQYRRIIRESKGVVDSESAAHEDEMIIHKVHKRLERERRRALREKHAAESGINWSIEFGGESDDDISEFEFPSRVQSNVSEKAHGGEVEAEDSMETVRQSPATILNPHPMAQDKHNQPAPPHSDGLEPPAPPRPSTTPLPSVQEGLPLSSLTGLEGTMYGAYEPEITRGRTPSIAGSTTSRGSRAEEIARIPEHFLWVPLMTLGAARATFRDTVLGLEYLHYQGVIHRDIKPANLLQTSDHHIKISDFGVSYLGRRSRENSSDDQSESDVQDVDEAVELAKTVGTPAFYAPELCQTDPDTETLPVTGQIDIWALGVTLYCLVFGRVPFHDLNTFVLMRQIAEEEAYIPRVRLKAVEQHQSRSDSHGRLFLNSNKRSQHELAYEAIEDDLYDLLRRLLTKDPRRRITLLEVKHHPWILQDIADPARWIQETDPSRATQGKRIEVSKEDVDEAVVSLKILDRVRSGLRKLGGAISTLGKSGSSRKRAKSTAGHGDTGPPSAASSSSHISQDAMRAASTVDQSIFSALKASREGEHPLSQSVSASPEYKDEKIDQKSYFPDTSSRLASPALTGGGSQHTSPSCAVRPSAPERASTAASIRTLKPSDKRQVSPTLIQGLPGTPLAIDTLGGNSLGGIFGGAGRRIMNSVRTRERSANGRDRSSHERSKSIDRLVGGSDDAHGEPSIAFSNTTVTGQVDLPSALKDDSPTTHSNVGSPSSPHTHSSIVHDFLRPARSESGISRHSSISSTASQHYPPGFGRRTSVQSGISGVGATEFPRSTSDERFSRAKDEFIRRRILEENQHRERPPSATFKRPPSVLSQEACPPSPDDEIFQRKQQEEEMMRQQVFNQASSIEASPTNYLISLPSTALPSSSSEDQFFSGMSQSTSNPSIPSVISANSSIVPDDGSTLDHHKDARKHSSDETINPASAPDEDEGYVGDHAIDSGEDSEEDFIDFTRHKAKKTGLTRSESVSYAELHRHHNARRARNSSIKRTASTKTTRSGSNGTVKKVRSHEGDGEAQEITNI